LGRDQFPDALLQDGAGIFARHRQHALSLDAGRNVGAAQNRIHRLLDEFRLALLDDQNRFFGRAEAHELGVDQRIGDVEHVERNAAVAESSASPRISSARNAVLYMPPCMTMPMSSASPSKTSLSLCSSMKRTAAGQRFSTFSRSCR